MQLLQLNSQNKTRKKEREGERRIQSTVNRPEEDFEPMGHCEVVYCYLCFRVGAGGLPPGSPTSFNSYTFPLCLFFPLYPSLHTPCVFRWTSVSHSWCGIFSSPFSFIFVAWVPQVVPRFHLFISSLCCFCSESPSVFVLPAKYIFPYKIIWYVIN